MKSEIREFYELRKNEVNEYFIFIGKLGIDSVKNYNIKIHSTKYIINDDLKKILKSNCMIILYNFIEGTISKAIEYIVDDINDNKIKYSELKKEYKKIILKTTNKIKKKDFEDINIKLVEFIENVFNECFEINWNNLEHKRLILQGGGNIDSKFIVDNISKKLEINFKKREQSLATIKKNRNDLAHGAKSFVEAGQDFTLSDIKKMKTNVFKYLSAFITAIEKYVENKKYKSSI